MALTFPNASRSYDDVRNVVRFAGYDGMFEVKFLVDGAALSAARLSEAGYLRAFDAARARIQAVALKVYKPRRGTTYTLRAADLR
jgi:hypothetical protein